MEINKIAQCSKMVPGMSGSEIRAVLETVNWDTSIAVKNLKIDKLYRYDKIEHLASSHVNYIFQDWCGHQT